MNKNLNFGITNCPNDLFMFYALINKKVEIENINFIFRFHDIEDLNNRAINSEYEITKASTALLKDIARQYLVLNSGSAFGIGGGPVLVSKFENLKENPLIALPGEKTTAHLLFKLFFKQRHQKYFCLYSEIIDLIMSDEVDAGVIIHEDRFKIEKLGLKKIIDLGEQWLKEYKLPLPLANIVCNKKLNVDFSILNKLLERSIMFAFANYDEVVSWIKEKNEKEDENILRQHIDFFVNQYSKGLNSDGLKAIVKLIGLRENNIILHDGYFEIKYL